MNTGWKKPRRFDRNIIVIGAGSAGLVSALVATKAGASVTLIELKEMGGDCLNTGCVPSKALIHVAHLTEQAKRAAAMGLTGPVGNVDTAAAMRYVRSAIAEVAPHDSVERYRSLGVDVRQGRARITSPWSVTVNGESLTTRAIIIAAGAEPAIPPIPGLAEAGYMTSETLWAMPEIPRRLLILGGGPIGCELSQAFSRLGSEVTLVQQSARLLVREDDEVSALVSGRLTREGVRVLTEHKAVSVSTHDGQHTMRLLHRDAPVDVGFDKILVAVGRKPRTSGYGLEELGIPLSDKGTIETNAYLQTLYPNIYACGDVAGPYQFTHAAGHQGVHASINALFGSLHKIRPDRAVMPAVTYTQPEVARAGLNEREAKAGGIPHEVTRYDLQELDRAIVDDAREGLVTILTVPGKDRILGVTIVAPRAGEMLAEAVLAMQHGIGLKKLFGTIHAYPTYSEATRDAGGIWRRDHAPSWLLAWLQRYHRWMRGGTA